MSADPGVIDAVEGGCPFCGADKYKLKSSYKEYLCGTMEAQGEVARGDACYTRQLSQQAELLQRAGEVVLWVKQRWLASTYEEGNSYAVKAQALLPEIEKALEKVR